jgi:hypothetical protein
MTYSVRKRLKRTEVPRPVELGTSRPATLRSATRGCRKCDEIASDDELEMV